MRLVEKTDVVAMTWASSEMATKVIEFVLRAGYGCEINSSSSSSVVAVTSMIEKGTPHINAEVWVGTLQELMDRGISEKKLTDKGDIYSTGGIEAWFIPAYLAEKHPNINTIQDVIANPQIFKDPEDPSKGRFYTCPSGWACSRVNKNLARAYGMDASYNIFDPGSGDNLAASISKAYARKQPWFGYYWAPTAILGKFPMKQIKMDAYDAKGHICNQDKNCATPHAGQYPVARIAKIMATPYANSNKDISKFMKKMAIPNDVVNKVLAWQEENKADYNQAAGYFMASYPKIWKKMGAKKSWQETFRRALT